MRGEVEGGGGWGAEREHLFIARSKLCANYKTLETRRRVFKLSRQHRGCVVIDLISGTDVLQFGGQLTALFGLLFN